MLIVQKALAGLRCSAPVDLISFPDGSERFIDDDGYITITEADVTRVRL